MEEEVDNTYVKYAESMVKFCNEKKDLREEVEWLTRQVVSLQQELTASKRANRFSAIVTLMQWGKEVAVDVMRAPP